MIDPKVLTDKLESLIRDELHRRYPDMSNAQVNLEVYNHFDLIARQLVEKVFSEEEKNG